MIGGCVINRRSYLPGEVSHYQIRADLTSQIVSAILLTIGLLILTFENSSVSVEKLQVTLIGVLLITVGLIGDGFMGNLQERVLRTHKISQTELV